MRTASALGLLLTAATVSVAASGIAGCGSPGTSRPKLASVAESWCPDGFEVGPTDTCFLLPEARGKGVGVVVFLHGMFVGRSSPEEIEQLKAVQAAGFAVVVPRGRRGLCDWKPELSSHFCWPKDPDDPQEFAAVVGTWDRVLWQVDALLEDGPHPRYVLGVANGGYFASYLALRGVFKADAWAVVGAGPIVDQPKAGVAAAPVLLVAAEGDAEQGPPARKLRDDLERAHWPAAFCPRPGPAELTKGDLDASLAFFHRAQKGELKGAQRLTCDGRPAPAPSGKGPFPGGPAPVPPAPGPGPSKPETRPAGDPFTP